MPGGRVETRLAHMLDALGGIGRLTADKTLDEYITDPDLAAAVERYLERLSEASRHLPDSLKDTRPEIDWRGVADIGNVLRHTYDQVIDRRVWQIVTDDLAPLREAVEAMIDTFGKDSE